MPPLPSPAVLVARFLRANRYDATLAAFLAEAGLPRAAAEPPDAAAVTLEQLLLEKSVFDVSQAYEKLGLDDADAAARAWSSPAPRQPHPAACLAAAANILSTTVASARQAPGPLLIATAADRQLHVLSVLAAGAPPQLTCAPSASSLPLGDSPTLCCHSHENGLVLAGSMAGHLSLFSLPSGALIHQRRDHRKYLVRIASARSRNPAGWWLATAAWDGSVLVYHLVDASAPPSTDGSDPPPLPSPSGRIDLASNPEAIAFIDHPDLDEPVLLLSRKDSTFLYYYTVPARGDGSCRLLGRQNLAPHSNAWIAFSPAAFAQSPTDPSLLAVATSHTPHMKLLMVRLLMPLAVDPSQASSDHAPLVQPPAAPVTQASQARADRAIQDREDAAILVQTSTLAPQSPYSTPQLAWRPDGTGVWVNGDDGAVRGIEATTGKVMATLTGGHDPGTKIRCIWAGTIHGQECVVSGGFDRQLVLWQHV